MSEKISRSDRHREGRVGTATSHLRVHAVLIVGAVVMIAPYLVQLSTSLQTLGEATAIPQPLLPADPQLSNYQRVGELIPFWQMLTNTVLVTGGRTIAQLFLCALAGYAFARMDFPGRGVLFGVFLSVLMVPSQLFLLPQFEMMASLGWLNTLRALIMPGMFSAFGTFLLRQFFMTLPRELQEAAELDGASHWKTFSHIMLPLAKPGLIALAVLDVIWSWNDLLWPLVVNNSPSKMPLSVGLSTLVGQYTVDVPVLMAASTLATLPVLITFIVLQKQFIAGIAFSGVKS